MKKPNIQQWELYNVDENNPNYIKVIKRMSEKEFRYTKKYLTSDELTGRQRETIQRFDKNKFDLRHWNSIKTRLAYAKSLYEEAIS